MPRKPRMGSNYIRIAVGPAGKGLRTPWTLPIRPNRCSKQITVYIIKHARCPLTMSGMLREPGYCCPHLTPLAARLAHRPKGWRAGAGLGGARERKTRPSSFAGFFSGSITDNVHRNAYSRSLAAGKHQGCGWWVSETFIPRWAVD